jgi:hypothetical protein
MYHKILNYMIIHIDYNHHHQHQHHHDHHQYRHGTHIRYYREFGRAHNIVINEATGFGYALSLMYLLIYQHDVLDMLHIGMR